QGEFQYEWIERTKCTLPDGREVFEEELPEDLAGVEIVSRRTVRERGRQLGIFRRSEGLMGRLLKAFMPERYAERGAVELTGKGGGPIEIVERLQAARNRLA